MVAALTVVFSLLGADPGGTPRVVSALEKEREARRPAYCTGPYASDFSALSKQATELAQKPESQFTYCVRTTAVYECLSYAPDGSMRRAKKTAVAHGTAFAYRREKSGDTLLVTNQHVAEYPAVSEDDHTIEGVPAGCKRVSDSIKIVDNERDDYETDDLTLSRVVSDPSLDLSVVRAKAELHLMPWKFGKSAGLRERNVVDVRGFPLGAFKAINSGSVITTWDHDDYKEWDHDDFVVDARLSTGQSGSPVLAVSCATGEYELVGVYHAGYSRGSSLNVVLHIDQARDLLTTLKRSVAPRPDAPNAPVGATERRQLLEAAGPNGVFFPFGPLTASVRARPEGTLVFNVYPKGFPLESWPAAVLEDLSPSDPTEFGDLGRVWFGNARGLKEQPRAQVSAELQAQLEHAIESLRRIASLSVAYRKAALHADESKEAFERAKRVEKSLKKATQLGKDIVTAVTEVAEREALKPGEKPDLPAPNTAPPMDAGP